MKHSLSASWRLGSLLYLLSLGTMANAASAQAAFPSDINADKLACSAQISKTLNDWKSQSDWHRGAPDMNGAVTYRTPTKQWGTWIHFRITADGQSELIRDRMGTRIRALWLKENCVPMLDTQALSPFYKELARSWTDQKLRDFVHKTKKGAIYVWSPHMPYSVRGLQQLPKLRKMLKSEVIVMLDPAAHEVAAKEVVKKYKFPKDYLMRFNSTELAMRNALVHFPSLIPYSERRVGMNILPGYRPAKEMQVFVDKEWKSASAR